MFKTKSSWATRLFIAAPFAIAALLNAIMLGVEHLHLRLDYIARYAFAFPGPWLRLANPLGIADRLNVQNPRLRVFIDYLALLWIPAVLYAACLWLLLVAARIAARPFLKHLDPHVLKTLKQRTAIISSIVVVASASWFVVKLCRDQIGCNKRGAAFGLQVESIERDADKQLSIGTEFTDVTRFYAEHGIPLQIVGSEASGVLYTSGCGPLGCGTDAAMIEVQVKLDSTGSVTEKPTVLGMYTDCM